MRYRQPICALGVSAAIFTALALTSCARDEKPRLIPSAGTQEYRSLPAAPEIDHSPDHSPIHIEGVDFDRRRLDRISRIV